MSHDTIQLYRYTHIQYRQQATREHSVFQWLWPVASAQKSKTTCTTARLRAAQALIPAARALRLDVYAMIMLDARCLYSPTSQFQDHARGAPTGCAVIRRTRCQMTMQSQSRMRRFIHHRPHCKLKWGFHRESELSCARDPPARRTRPPCTWLRDGATSECSRAGVEILCAAYRGTLRRATGLSSRSHVRRLRDHILDDNAHLRIGRLGQL